MELDAATTDAVLATVAGGIGLGGMTSGRSAGARIAGCGAFGVGLAAAAGTLRFSVVPDLAPIHEALSAAAGALGVPWLAIGAALHLLGADRRWVAVALVPAVGLPFAGIEGYRVAVSSLALVGAVGAAGWVGRSDPRSAALTVAGSVGIAVAGLGIAGDGAWFGLSRLGWFHLALALSVGLLGTAALTATATGARPPATPAGAGPR